MHFNCKKETQYTNLDLKPVSACSVQVRLSQLSTSRRAESEATGMLAVSLSQAPVPALGLAVMIPLLKTQIMMRWTRSCFWKPILISDQSFTFRNKGMLQSWFDGVERLPDSWPLPRLSLSIDESWRADSSPSSCQLRNPRFTIAFFVQWILRDGDATVGGSA